MNSILVGPAFRKPETCGVPPAYRSPSSESRSGFEMKLGGLRPQPHTAEKQKVALDDLLLSYRYNITIIVLLKVAKYLNYPFEGSLLLHWLFG